jgi:cyclohexanecarboxylate-CoA ligase
MTFMLGSAESKVLVIPRDYRGFGYEAMADAIRPALPALQHVLVIGGAGRNAFESLLDADDPPPQRFAASRPGPDEVIEILYTSGTTGEPKGVMHTSNTLYSNILPYAARLGLGKDDNVLMASPLAHQTGFMYGIMMPIVLGGKVVFQDIWNAAKAVDLIAAEGATFTMAATPFLSDMADEASRRPEAVASLRTFLSAGAPIPRPLVRRAAEHLGANIISAWGMTENGAVTTTCIGDPPEKAFETDGCAMAGMEIRVVDEQGASGMVRHRCRRLVRNRRPRPCRPRRICPHHRPHKGRDHPWRRKRAGRRSRRSDLSASGDPGMRRGRDAGRQTWRTGLRVRCLA